MFRGLQGQQSHCIFRFASQTVAWPSVVTSYSAVQGSAEIETHLLEVALTALV